MFVFSVVLKSVIPVEHDGVCKTYYEDFINCLYLLFCYACKSRQTM